MQILSGQIKKHSRKVEDPKALKKVAREMERLCQLPLGKKPYAMALAHCQVDHEDPQRFFVKQDGTVVVNPKITAQGGKFQHVEGCMSFPYRDNKKVTRYGIVDVEYQNEKGELIKERLNGLEACIFQHEIDHMNGKSIYS